MRICVDAKLEIVKAQQEEAFLAFQQSLLNASAEVSNALFMYCSAKEKTAERTEQMTVNLYHALDGGR